MKLIAVLTTLLLFCLSGLLPAPALAATNRSIKILSSSSSTIAAVSHCKRHSNKGEITIRVRVKGLKKFVVPPTKKPIQGAGAVEVFYHQIPARAYKRYPTNNFLGAVAGTKLQLCLSLTFLGKKGKHKLFVTLGKSTGTLYSGVKPATMTVTIK